MMPVWQQRMVEDLRAASADLLEPGLNGATRVASSLAAGPLARSLLSMIDNYLALLPGLLDVEAAVATAESDLLLARTPVYGVVPTAPYAFQRKPNGEGLLPIVWLRADCVARPELPRLRWLLHIHATLEEKLGSHVFRMERRIAEALAVRAGESDWAAADARIMATLLGEVRQRQTALRKSRGRILRQASVPIRPSEQAPSPFPLDPVWSRLRHLVRGLLDPPYLLRELARSFCALPVEMADVPYLYQRWCGLQLFAAFARAGWAPAEGDVIGSLYLGGSVTLRNLSGGSLTVWVDPRISSITRDLTGWECTDPANEITPDFLITCGKSGQRDAYVLDATLGTSPEMLEQKSRYRHLMAGVTPRFIAGIPMLRRPMRAWAIAPLRESHCRLGDPEGFTGSIPLNPATETFKALDAWVADVSRHARLAELPELPP